MVNFLSIDDIIIICLLTFFLDLILIIFIKNLYIIYFILFIAKIIYKV